MLDRGNVAEDARSLRFENRALRAILLLCGLAWLADRPSLRAQTFKLEVPVTPFKVEAREFVLLDQAGDRQAVLGVGPDGKPELVFFRPDGKRGMVISERPQLQPAR